MIIRYILKVVFLRRWTLNQKNEITVNQIKKLRNRILDVVKRIDILLLIKIARVVGVPIQKDLLKKYEK